MTREQIVFIQILSDYLNNRKTTINLDGLEWKDILLIARKQQVSGIVYSQVNKYMPLDVSEEFYKELIATLYSQSRIEYELNRIKKDLSISEVPFFIIKGKTIAALYPNPLLRTMGDIDVVVHSSDREKCHRIMIDRGFECNARLKDREWQYFKMNMEFEFHDHLVYKEVINERIQFDFFNDYWQYVQDGELDWNFHLLFLIFHLRKHLMNAGAGFRPFMDIAIVAQKRQLDWKWIEGKLERIEMLVFAKKCYGVIERWFGIGTPLASAIDDDFYNIITEKVFNDGLFGLNNIDNSDAAIINTIRGKKHPKLNMIRIVLKRIFPPRNEMQGIKEYEYLNRFVILLPIAWIQRFIKRIRAGGIKAWINDIKGPFRAQDRINKRSDMLNKWGL